MFKNLLQTKGHLVTISRQLSSRDTFGDLSRTGAKSLKVDITNKFYPEDPDNYDKEEFDLAPRKNAYFYKFEISKYARQGPRGLHKALLLYEEMKTVARLTPSYDNYAPLIFGCAKAGFTKRAFELYQEMQKYDPRGKQPKALVDCLMFACGTCPFPEYGLERLKWLMQHLKISCNYQFDQAHYHSAMLSFGRLGCLDESVKLLQEMLDRKILPKTKTFNVLLSGCVSNKEAGTTLALRVYKRMKLYGVKPDIETYRLFARCIRDCGMGSLEMMQETLEEMPAMTTHNTKLRYKMLAGHGRTRLEREYSWLPMLQDLCKSLNRALNPKIATGQNSCDTDSTKALERPREKMIKTFTDQQFPMTVYCDKDSLPNLLSDDHLETLSKIKSIDYNALRDGKGRLMLFGGARGYLEMMIKDRCEPDVIVFGFLLCCTDKKRGLQIECFRLSQEFNIKRDQAFYNLLLSHVVEDYLAISRLDFARELIDHMYFDGLKPDVNTYEILASACNNTKDALQYLKDIEDGGIIVTEKMIHKLMWVALRRTDFDFMTTILEQYKSRGIRPTKKIIEFIENKRLATSDLILKKERGLLDPDKTPCWFTEREVERFKKFQNVLSDWLRQVEVDPGQEDHPWEQYQVESMSKRGPQENDIISTLRPILKARREMLQNVEQ